MKYSTTNSENVNGSHADEAHRESGYERDRAERDASHDKAAGGTKRKFLSEQDLADLTARAIPASVIEAAGY